MAVRDERMENVDIWILANLTASSKHENLACKIYFVFTFVFGTSDNIEKYRKLLSEVLPLLVLVIFNVESKQNFSTLNSF